MLATSTSDLIKNGMNSTPSAERTHIAFFGVRNAGKSSLVNAVTGQDLSVVSDVMGTTTDPVRKAMELLPIGPVVIIDTPGIDDSGPLGEERVRRAEKILSETDMAVLVVSAAEGMTEADRGLIRLFEEKDIPFLIALNKTDLTDDGLSSGSAAKDADGAPVIRVSALRRTGIEGLKEALGSLAKNAESKRPLVSDLVNTGDTVVLVIPIDSSAPKGRLILPQQMVIRELLDKGAVPVAVRDTEYPDLLLRLCHSDADAEALSPAMVITDSQVFEKIAALTPEDVPLTSFSMLMARYKGTLDQAVRGARAIRELADGDTVLISEGCTHHRQCGDIGTVKIPGWLRSFTKKDLSFAFTSGRDFPEDLSPYALVIHCGGCMLNEREMRSRSVHAEKKRVPMTNYGTAIAEMHHILDRCIKPLM